MLVKNTVPCELQFNVEFLLLWARQLADVLTATITDLYTNVTLHINNKLISSQDTVVVVVVAIAVQCQQSSICGANTGSHQTGQDRVKIQLYKGLSFLKAWRPISPFPILPIPTSLFPISPFPAS